MRFPSILLWVLSELPQAKAWLSQFHAADQTTAQALLDGLRLVSASEFSRTMGRLFTEVIESRPDEDFAFYPARELASGERYFSDKRKKPVAVPHGSVGSEGHVAALLTKFCAGHQRAREWPPISILKARRVSNIVVVDDMAISGTRAASFTRDALMAVPAIRSSCSLGLTRIHLVAHTVTDEAEQYFCDEVHRWRRMRAEGRVEIHRAHRRGLRPMSEVHGIRELAAKYPASLPGHLASCRFGYAESMSGTVFQHSCPNNVPALCWAKAQGWHPLFPDRAVPPALQAAFVDTGTRATEFPRPASADILAVLKLQRRRRLTETRLRHATGLSTLTIRWVSVWARALKLLDEHGRVTDAGRCEIRRLDRTAESQDFEPVAAVPYHPTQLRASKVYL